MSFATRHNKATSNVFTYQQTADAPFYKCKDLFAQGYTEDKKKPAVVRGCYISRAGKFGPAATLICEGFNVNLPAHLTDEIDDMMKNADDIADINGGKVGVYAYEYVNSRGSKSYSVRWTDLEQLPF